MQFNERARINGEIATDAQLLPSFAAVEQARTDTHHSDGLGIISLTYFEFTTLAIVHSFSQYAQQQRLDAVILEVGLGGRLDAVNAFTPSCAIITSIDLDHQDYLGDTREAIGWEKAHIFRADTPAICADPLPPQTLLDYATEIGADLWRMGVDYNYSGDKQQWAYGGRNVRRHSLAYPALRGANQLLNAAAALAALESLSLQLPVSQQAIREGLASAEIAGRFQVLAGQPTVILDVAHNPHAAATLAHNLDHMGYFPYTFAVFGMLHDKDIEGVIQRMKGVIDEWFIGTLDGARGTTATQLHTALREAGIPADCIHRHDTITLAYQSALNKAADNDRIGVFGSFLTVAQVIEARSSRLA
jgi:dihydrofolate synthase/folylpolyglutamate synthase